MEKLSLMQRIERLPREVVGARVPPPELVAFTVIVSRNLMGWKQSTLADFAGVSTSTVERIERGERVRPAQLDKVAIALGHDAGYFTSPREQKSSQEAAESIADEWGSLVPIQVERVTTQPQVRALVRGHALLVNAPECDAIAEDIRGLAEWLDLGSFLFSEILPPDPAEILGRRREFYRDVLAAVRSIEAKGYTVLAGRLKDDVDGMSDWRITLISISPKSTDPAAPNRKVMFVDKRHWGPNTILGGDRAE